MKPRPSPSSGDQGDLQLQKTKLSGLVHGGRPLVKLAQDIDWQHFDEVFGSYYSEQGRIGISTRLLVALQYLKYSYDLSDEDVVQGWLENPY